MSDETPTQETQEAVEEVVEAPEAPSITDEQVAEYLGYESVDDLQKARNLPEWERTLRRKSMGLDQDDEPATEEPAKEPAPDASTVSADDNLTPEARAILEREIEAALKQRGILDKVDKASTFADVYARQVATERDRAVDAWAAEHQDAKFDELTDIIETHNLKQFTGDASGVKYALDTALGIWQAKPENMESLVASAVEKRLQEMVADGEEVVGVKPRREGVEEEADTRDFDDIEDEAERYALVRKRLSKK